MGNENNTEVKADATSQVKANAEVNTALVAKNQSTEKATSIIPPKGSLEPLRPTLHPLGTESIHVVHIIVFIAALLFLFGGMWKYGKKTKF